MSSVPVSGQASSNKIFQFEDRLEQLNTLKQSVMRDSFKEGDPSEEAVSAVSAVFTAFDSLTKHDQNAIHKEISILPTDTAKVERQKQLISIVEARRERLSQRKESHAFQVTSIKNQTTPSISSPMQCQKPVEKTLTVEKTAAQILPPKLLIELPPELLFDAGSFLTPIDMVSYQRSCKTISKMQLAPETIKTHHLEPLIETYLHRSYSELTPSEKTKALHELLSLAYSLSKIEELEEPNYSSLNAFFKKVEARNLIRMVRAAISDRTDVPNLPVSNLEIPEDAEETLSNLEIPEDAEETLQKAQGLRVWMEDNKEFFSTITGLNLSQCDLSLLPKEIGQLQALKRLHLDGNKLTTLPKEIGDLRELQVLWLHEKRLVTLPKEIGKLQALQVLYFAEPLPAQ